MAEQVQNNVLIALNLPAIQNQVINQSRALGLPNPAPKQFSPSEIHSSPVIREERSVIARYADCFGYIPIIGSAVGLLRVLVSIISFGIFKFLNTAFQHSNHSHHQVMMNRSVHEMKRGFVELFSFALSGIVMDQILNDREERGVLENCIAHGKYYFASKNHHDVVYGTLDYQQDGIEISFKTDVAELYVEPAKLKNVLLSLANENSPQSS